MKMNRHLIKLAVLSTVFWSQIGWSISKEMHAMVRMETGSNAIGSDSLGKPLRDAAFVRMEHYEIPLELVEKDIADRANKGFVDSMIFERDGKKFVRWVINPEDTKWHLEVAKFMEANGVKPEKKKFFIAYKTASRSYIIVNPQTGSEFSVKMSTDHTGGHWKDKQQTWDDALQIRRITDYVADQVAHQPALKNTILLDEPMAFGIKSLDQGIVIRSYENLTKSGNRYVPGFSAVHEKLGTAIAKANGSGQIPALFWMQHYNLPLARALAEFLALTGMSYDSPHSQNFLVELDSKNRPTGRIVLRDFGDTFLSEEYFKAAGREDITKIWEQTNVKKGYIPMAVGILHGNKPPSWLDLKTDYYSAKSMTQWAREFYAEYDAEFKRQTGYVLPSVNNGITRSGNYFQYPLSIRDLNGIEFLKLVKKGEQRNELLGRTCSLIF